MATPDSSALFHLRILEIGELPASYAGHYLADLGADVIKVEPPGGDPVRQEPPFAGPSTDSPTLSGSETGQTENDLDRSLKFIHINANKRSIVLDLSRAEDRKTFLDLAKTVDAVIEACPVGYLGGLGIGYEQLTAVRPGIVVTSITPFGQTGPFKSFKGNNGTVEAMAGAVYTLGDDTRSPVISPNDFLTQIAAIHGASSTLAALYHRRKGGPGQRIDVSVQDVGTQVTTGLSEYSQRRTIKRRPGASTFSGTTSIYATKDGFMFLQPNQPHMLNALIAWMDDPVLKGPEWQDREYRSQNADVINMLIENFTSSLTTADWLEGAQSKGIPTAPINTVPQFVDSEQVKALGSFTPKEHPVVGTYKTIDFMRMSASPVSFRRAAPSLDQHRADILAEARASRTQPVRGEALGPRSLPVAAAPVGGSHERRKLPLEGVRVLDFTRVIAGPGGTQVLAYLGAEVIKVESKTLNTGRDGNTGGFSELNRNKKSITLNVTTPEGRDLAFRLAEKSDIVINNFSAFVMDRLGLGYEDLTKAKKDVIYIRMPGFGRTGPLKDWLAFGQILQSYTGMVSMWRHPESSTKAGIKGPVGDYVSSASVVLASLAAIEYRDRTGKGQIVDLNMLEALAATLNPFYMDYLVNRRTPQPLGYRSARYAPYGAYPCRGNDEWCVVAVETEEEWRAFQKAIGEPGWAFDPRFQTKAGRIEHREELDTNIATWTREYTKQQVTHFLQRDGVPAGAIQSAEDLFYDYHLRKRGHIVELRNPEPWGVYDTYGAPARFSLTPAVDAVPVPSLGEHNEEVFKGLLGLSDAEYERLVKAKGIY